MIRLKNWNAKRAGAGITVQGVNVSTGQIVKVVGVVEMHVVAGPSGHNPVIVARTKDAEYALSPQL